MRHTKMIKQIPEEAFATAAIFLYITFESSKSLFFKHMLLVIPTVKHTKYSKLSHCISNGHFF